MLKMAVGRPFGITSRINVLDRPSTNQESSELRLIRDHAGDGQSATGKRAE